jgi:hypothetical protein
LVLAVTVFESAGAVVGLTIVIIGAVVSIVKEGRVSMFEIFPAASVTLIVQVVYVPSARLLNVTIFEPTVAVVVALEHDPP